MGADTADLTCLHLERETVTPDRRLQRPTADCTIRLLEQKNIESLERTNSIREKWKF